MDNLITLQREENHWPLEWVNPSDPNETVTTHGFVHPIGQWITVGGPLSGNYAQKVDLLQHPESSQAHLVLTVVDIRTMGVKNYVPRRDFEAISQLMERRRDAEGRTDQQAAEASDQEGSGEGILGKEEAGAVQTAAGY
jgi:hypothetical protein